MPRGPGHVRLLVLNYNGGAFLHRCFEHLRRLDWPADELELVLIDNASSDGSADAIERAFPEVRVVRNDRNAGFPANNLGLEDLDGVRYVGLVNNDGFVEPGWLRALVDTLDADPGLGAAAAKLVFAPRFVDLTIEAPASTPRPGDTRELGVMIRGVTIEGTDRFRDVDSDGGSWGVEHDGPVPFRWTSDHTVLRVPVDDDLSDATVCATVRLQLRADEPKKVTLSGGGSPVVVEVDETPRWFPVTVTGTPYDVVQNAGSFLFADGAGADRGFGQRDVGQFEHPEDVFAWCGGSVLLRPAYVEATGAFDERFFLYYEDTDWSWRGRAQGWRYRYVPTAVMRHMHAATSEEGSPVFAYHVERNRLLMLVKNAPVRLVLQQILQFLLVTASYGRRDILGALRSGRRPNPVTVRRRLGSFVGFLRLLPVMVNERRRLRARRSVDDGTLTAWFVSRDAS